MNEQTNLKHIDLTEARATLVELLRYGDLPHVSGLWELSDKDRAFLTTTCAATVISHVITITSGYNEAEALVGYHALQADVIEQIKRLCRERPHDTETRQ